VLLASENFSLYTVVAVLTFLLTFLGQLKALLPNIPWPERDNPCLSLLAICRTLLSTQCACSDIWRICALHLFTSPRVLQVFVYLPTRLRLHQIDVRVPPAGRASVAPAGEW